MTTRFMLDTNTVSFIARGRSGVARARLANLKAYESVCISSVTEGEILYGLARNPGAHAVHAALGGFLRKMKVLPWGRAEAKVYGELRARLEAAGKTLGNLDLLIAAHAIAAEAVLVTHDQAFSGVMGANVTVNWATDIKTP